MFLGCELHKKTILSLNSTIFHPLFRVFGKIVFILSDNPYFWKDLLISKLKNLSYNYLFRFFLLYSVFNERLCAPRRPDHAIKKLITRFSSASCFVRSMRGALVGPSGLEPPTSCLSGTRSNLLSYEPISLFALFHFLKKRNLKAPFLGRRNLRLVEMMGFEPMTPCLQGRCSPS